MRKSPQVSKEQITLAFLDAADKTPSVGGSSKLPEKLGVTPGALSQWRRTGSEKKANGVSAPMLVAGLLLGMKLQLGGALIGVIEGPAVTEPSKQPVALPEQLSLFVEFELGGRSVGSHVQPVQVAHSEEVVIRIEVRRESRGSPVEEDCA